MIANQTTRTLPSSPRLAALSTEQEIGFWTPLCLFFIGWAAYCIRTNLVFECAAGASSLLVIRVVYILLFKRRDIRLTWVTGCGLLLGYGIGTCNTALQLAKSGQTIAEHFTSPQGDFSEALAIAIWVSGALFLLGALAEHPITINLGKLAASDVIFICVGLLIVTLALATGETRYMGANVSDDRHVTALGTISGLIGPLLPALTVLLKEKSRFLRRSVVLWIVLLIELGTLVPQGRRTLLYAVVLTVLAFNLRGSKWKMRLWKKAAVIAVCISGLYVTNLVFYAMRYSAEQAGVASRMGAPDLSSSELITRALDFLKNGRDSSFDESVAENLRDRTFVLPYFSELLVNSRTHHPLYGGLFLFALKMATPTAIYSIYGDKATVLAIGMEEILANPSFGLFPTDEANSLLTSGISDFGIAGTFLYPFLLCLLINLSIRVLLARTSEIMRILVLLGFVYCLFQTETSLTAMVVTYRNLAILVLVAIPLDMVFRFFSRSKGNSIPGKSGLQPSDVTLVRYDAVVDRSGLRR